MKKPLFDRFDRFMMAKNHYIGRSVRRKLKLLKIIRYVRKH